LKSGSSFIRVMYWLDNVYSGIANTYIKYTFIFIDVRIRINIIW